MIGKIVKFFKPSKVVDLPEQKKKLSKSEALDELIEKKQENIEISTFTAYAPPDEIIGQFKAANVKANDSMPCYSMDVHSYGTSPATLTGYAGFKGYPYLAILAQRPEYMKMVRILSDNITRNGFELNSTAPDEEKESKADRIQALKEACNTFNVDQLLNQAFKDALTFGVGYIGINVRGDDSRRSTKLVVDKAAFNIGELKQFKRIEPIWLWATQVNVLDPFADDFYAPQHYNMIGQQMHTSRLLKFVPFPVSDTLKPNYNYGGISLIQAAEDVVNNYLVMRNAATNAVKNKSTLAIGTDMSSILQAGCDFNDIVAYKRGLTVKADQLQDGKGLVAFDNTTESVNQIDTPLVGMSELRDQSRDDLRGVAEIPEVMWEGKSPTGQNASSVGEFMAFFNMIKSIQEAVALPNLKIIINLLQLDLFGDIDKSIEIKFNPLWSPTDKELAEINALKITSLSEALMSSAITSPEFREALIRDENSGFGWLPKEPPEDSDEDFLGGLSLEETIEA